MKLTDADLARIQSLHCRTPYQITGVSQSQFSIARYYGGVSFQGCSYTYDPTDDTLTRDDVIKALRRKPKAEQLAKESGQ